MNPLEQPDPQRNSEADQEVKKNQRDYRSIKQLPWSQEGWLGVRPKYTHASGLTLMAGKFTEASMKMAEENYNLATLTRNPVLEKAEMKGRDDQIIRPKEIADANFKEMERATAQKWYYTLIRFFSSKSFSKIPVNRKGETRIAIPGCHLGFEIGGMLDFLNAQGIRAHIDAVDIEEAGTERQFMKLSEREQISGSRVEFHSQTDARDFFKGKETDIVVLRHPGFVFEVGQYPVWKEVVKTMAETRPGIIILSTYNHKTDDEAFIDLVLNKPDKKEIYEGEVFDDLLREQGYHTPHEYETMVDSELLRYPMSPYMIAYDRDPISTDQNPQLRFELPVDNFMQIYGSQEYLSKTQS